MLRKLFLEGLLVLFLVVAVQSQFLGCTKLNAVSWPLRVYFRPYVIVNWGSFVFILVDICQSLLEVWSGLELSSGIGVLVDWSEGLVVALDFVNDFQSPANRSLLMLFLHLLQILLDSFLKNSVLIRWLTARSILRCLSYISFLGLLSLLLSPLNRLLLPLGQGINRDSPDRMSGPSKTNSAVFLQAVLAYLWTLVRFNASRMNVGSLPNGLVYIKIRRGLSMLEALGV